jgi:hypothetical protein
MAPDRFLVDKVVGALRACPWNASAEQMAVAMIEAVQNHERCCMCHEAMWGPTICDVCAQDEKVLDKNIT